MMPFNLWGEDPTPACLVLDMRSGKVLHGLNQHTLVYPASLTKMMTLYIVFDALARKKIHLWQRIRMSPRAAAKEPSKLGLPKGQTLTYRDSILAMTCRSANDVATAIAEALSRREDLFAKQMTKTARRLGLKNTTFRNASGLFHPNQKTTAHDMSLLVRALLRRFPHYVSYFRAPSFKFRGKLYRTRAPLLKTVPGIRLVKTGYIRKSGFNLATSVRRKGKDIMVIVMGGKSARHRNALTADLIDTAFKEPYQLPLLTAHMQTNWDPVSYLVNLNNRDLKSGRTLPLRKISHSLSSDKTLDGLLKQL
jgi:D-alanyl-D-alanine carboxypeptidase